MKNAIPRGALLTVLALTMACGEKAPRQEDEMPGMEGMRGMAGMPMKMPGMEMMAAMRAHMDSIAGAPANRMIDMLADHDSMVLHMLNAMESDMRGMNIAADPAWSALADSIRRDLQEIPILSGDDLIFRIRLHAARMRRLMNMHEGMMKGMGM